MKSYLTLAAAALLSLSVSQTALAHCEFAEADTSAQDIVNEAVIKAEGLEITNARTRAMLAGQKVGGGYVTIKNTSAKDETLVSVSSGLASRMEVHEMTMDDGVMKMRKLEAGLVIPAGESVILAPGAKHLMFFGIEKPFAEGEMVPVEFTFENAGTVKVDLKTTPASSAKEKTHP